MLMLIFTVMTGFFANAAQDPYLWLEEVEGKKAIEWVKKQNDVTVAKLEADPRFKKFENEAVAILNAKDKLASGALRGNFVYNFWQDEKSVRGLWRRATLASYNSGKPEWEILIDFDKLAETEKENWVFKGSACLGPKYELCLLSLSRGGKDAVVTREYSIPKKQFIADGFNVPEVKGQLEWYNENTVLASVALNEKMTTDSGYGKQVQVWKRGEKLLSAPVAYEVQKTDIGAWVSVSEEGDKKVIVLTRSIDTLNKETSILADDLKTVTKLPLPTKAGIQGFFKDQMLASSDEDWSVKNSKGSEAKIKAGELVSFDYQKYLKDGVVDKLSVLFTQKPTTALSGVWISKNYVLMSFLDNVKSQLLRKTLKNGHWTESKIAIQDQGTIAVVNTTPYQDDFFISNTNFLTPTQILYSNDKGKTQVVQALPARFVAKDLMVEQKFATSADGTKIPYFIIRSKKTKLDGNNPTLLYGYGGFGVSMLPSYLAVSGKLWLERGGTYVMSNIRGGEEYGPNWHLSAVLENRNKCYEDFIAIAEQLIKSKYTSPAKLAIQGGSNGGLLVSATMVLRPDLFGAVISEVPLTDMLRFHKLLAGASWMGEYGNPEEEKMKEFWTKYSPYQNVKSEVKYPSVFFTTSTKDDRVHPGHARKMAARMIEFGKDVSYFENIEGGHSASANLLQMARRQALVYTFLSERLGLK